MFEANVYSGRRKRLLQKMAQAQGIAVFVGNVDAAMNYRGNDYKFRQDSNFLYYWGVDEPWFAAVLDLDSGEECLYGNDVDIDDIIWMGPQPSVASKGEAGGCARTLPLAEFDKAVAQAVSQGRPVHFLPPARYYNQSKLAELTGIPYDQVRKVAPMAADGGRHASEELVKAVVSMRLVKEACEIEEIDKACDLGYLMHTEARRGCKPGVLEQEIVGRMEGVTLSKGWGVSFTTILSQNGETLHNHSHHQILTEGRLIVIDAGHGGSEKGALGCLGDMEKNINLKIASELKEQLSLLNATVVMTRECDANVSLDDRVKIAKVNGADLFISVHLNSIPDVKFDTHRHRGTSVYYYNQNSKDLAKIVQKSIVNELGTRNDGVKSASFAVIRPTEYLGVLVEVAYMTNPIDSVLYTKEEFSQNTAKAIADGILNFVTSP